MQGRGERRGRAPLTDMGSKWGSNATSRLKKPVRQSTHRFLSTSSLVMFHESNSSVPLEKPEGTQPSAGKKEILSFSKATSHASQSHVPTYTLRICIVTTCSL